MLLLLLQRMSSGVSNLVAKMTAEREPEVLYAAHHM